MNRYPWFSIILITAAVISCGKKLPEFKNVDLTAWKEDKNGCLGHRKEMVEGLQSEKEKLLALNEMQIVELLGKSDQRELYKRNQKFFYYFLEPAADCKIAATAPKKLVVRFNAMGLAKEAFIE
jgi:hypothetical protein